MFFEKFREALARLPAGLIRAGSAAAVESIAAIQKTSGITVPAAYAEFLRSFDGADLFHEAVLLAGLGVEAPRRLRDLNVDNPTNHEPVFAEVAGGDRYAFRADGGVVRVRAGSDERWFAGGDFARWLDGLLAYHKVLYGADGEFVSDAFEPDGSEVLPVIVLKQTERALRSCPDSAEWQHERGVALRRLGRLTQAKDAFASAAAFDPVNPWAHFDFGRVALDLGPGAAREAGAAFEAAARLEGADAAGRLWAWAARAAWLEAAPARLEQCRREAISLQPDLPNQLQRALQAARDDGDPNEIAEAEALIQALGSPIQSGRVRLPIVQGTGAAPVSAAKATPARPTPPPGPRRPVRATTPRSGGRRRG